MAPSATNGHDSGEFLSNSETPRREPLKLSGALDRYESFDVTPVIGTEFKNVNLAEWINGPNSDELLRDLAITISRRGVVFFRAQDDLTNDLQKTLNHRLGQLTGKPSTSSLHIHPILNDSRELGGGDPQISTISSVQRKTYYDAAAATSTQSARIQASAQWHSDIQFEPVPADYTSLRLVELPSTGGDTLWASGYDLYDRLSPPYQRFVESLTADFEAPFFNDVAAKGGFQVYSKPRGSPENTGDVLKATHPVVRTNPVTGWKSIFAVGEFPKRINGLTPQESDHLRKWFLDLIYQNHELQVRFKWANKNDLAIWDNRSAFHSATFDYDDFGPRFGNRAVGIGERPYFDARSESRRQGLAREAKLAGV